MRKLKTKIDENAIAKMKLLYFSVGAMAIAYLDEERDTKKIFISEDFSKKVAELERFAVVNIRTLDKKYPKILNTVSDVVLKDVTAFNEEIEEYAKNSDKISNVSDAQVIRLKRTTVDLPAPVSDILTTGATATNWEVYAVQFEFGKYKKNIDKFVQMTYDLVRYALDADIICSKDNEEKFGIISDEETGEFTLLRPKFLNMVERRAIGITKYSIHKRLIDKYNNGDIIIPIRWEDINEFIKDTEGIIPENGNKEGKKFISIYYSDIDGRMNYDTYRRNWKFVTKATVAKLEKVRGEGIFPVVVNKGRNGVTFTVMGDPYHETFYSKEKAIETYSKLLYDYTNDIIKECHMNDKQAKKLYATGSYVLAQHITKINELERMLEDSRRITFSNVYIAPENVIDHTYGKDFDAIKGKRLYLIKLNNENAKPIKLPTSWRVLDNFMQDVESAVACYTGIDNESVKQCSLGAIHNDFTDPNNIFILPRGLVRRINSTLDRTKDIYRVYIRGGKSLRIAPLTSTRDNRIGVKDMTIEEAMRLIEYAYEVSINQIDKELKESVGDCDIRFRIIDAIKNRYTETINEIRWEFEKGKFAKYIK